MSKHDRKGRSTGVLHVRMDHSVFYSPAYRALSHAARAMLLEVVGLYNGKNNGELFLGARDAAKLLGVADPQTALDALKELREHGLLAVSTPGHFHIKERHATSYRLTFLPTPGRASTLEYRSWKAEPGSRQAKRLLALQHCKLRSDFATIAVRNTRTERPISDSRGCTAERNFPTSDLQEGQLAGEPTVQEFPTHVDYHGGVGNRATSLQCAATASRALQLCAAKGIGSQRRLAVWSGLTESRISRFLHKNSGRRTLTVAELDRLDAALDRLNQERVVDLKLRPASYRRSEIGCEGGHNPLSRVARR